MTLLLYAGRKGWSLQSVTVGLSHERVPARDAEGREEPGRTVEVIHRHIVVKGSLNEEQRRRLGEIAQRCPVTRTLSSPPRIEDTIEVSQQQHGG